MIDDGRSTCRASESKVISTTTRTIKIPGFAPSLLHNAKHPLPRLASCSSRLSLITSTLRCSHMPRDLANVRWDEVSPPPHLNRKVPSSTILVRQRPRTQAKTLKEHDSE